VEVEKELFWIFFEKSLEKNCFGEEEEEDRRHCIEDQQEDGGGKP